MHNSIQHAYHALHDDCTPTLLNTLHLHGCCPTLTSTVIDIHAARCLPLSDNNNSSMQQKSFIAA
jgi:hypothetical protein